MKHYYYFLFILLFLFSCANEPKQKVEGVNIYQVVDPNAGLNLQAVGALIKNGSVKSASDLEKQLNTPGGLNNLDLNKDGTPDYINVKENVGTANVKSFDLYTKENEVVDHLATLEVQMSGEQYQMNIAGNPNIYGQNAYYQDQFDIGDAAIGFALGAWMFSDREPYYHEPYRRGYYPSYYRPYKTVSTTVYKSRTQPMVKSSGFTKTTAKPLKTKSTYVGKTSPSTRTKFSNSTKNMKKMQARDNKKEVKKGGFTNSSSSSKKTLTPKKSYTPKKSNSYKRKSSSSNGYKRKSSSSPSRSSRSRSSRRRN